MCRVLDMTILYYAFLFLRYSILNQEKDYESITESKVTSKYIKFLNCIILNVAFNYVDIIYKLLYYKFETAKNIILCLLAVETTFPGLYLQIVCI